MKIKLNQILDRQSPPKPWDEAEKIPWNNPEFSQRMLDEHLTQDHDMASRRFKIIDKHVEWIHTQVLKEKPTRILDLCCGPGLYTQRLAQLGHQCVGIDFSPASITYAKQQANQGNPDCEYFHDDIRSADFGSGFSLVMSIFGEFNVFRPAEAKNILQKANQALDPGGFLVMEPHSFEKVAWLGKQPPSWHTEQGGLFSKDPHLFLLENFWDATKKVAIQRIYIIDAATGEVTPYGSSTQAYTDEEYLTLLTESGFGEIEFFPSLGDQKGGPQGDLFTIFARKIGNP